MRFGISSIGIFPSRFLVLGLKPNDADINATLSRMANIYMDMEYPKKALELLTDLCIELRLIKDLLTVPLNFLQRA